MLGRDSFGTLLGLMQVGQGRAMLLLWGEGGSDGSQLLELPARGRMALGSPQFGPLQVKQGRQYLS